MTCDRFFFDGVYCKDHVNPTDNSQCIPAEG
jgi:hypothetical protein